MMHRTLARIRSRKERALQTMKSSSRLGSYRSIFIGNQKWKKGHRGNSISDREISDTLSGMITVKTKELEAEIYNSNRSIRD